MPEVWRPTKEQISAAYGRRLRDVIAPGLRILFCGINPSLYSGAVGHHFARPGNRFWPALYASGLTPRLLSAFEDGELPEFGFGITNIVNRATASADELSSAELVAGARRLKRKVRKYKPEIVAFVGITAYRIAFGRAKAPLGLQNDRLAESRIWILPNPSGLNAHYQLPQLAAMFAKLRAYN